ncbi:MAG: GLPGLI family protein [Thermonemataceae bacterium]|nr:GLPGLI family protein [Thermonemataceae bacterium]
MKKYIFAFLLIIGSTSGYGQKKYLKYSLLDGTGVGVMMLNDTISYWQEFYDEGSSKGGMTVISGNSPIFVVKEIKKNFIYFSQKLGKKEFIVTDSLHPMKWILGKEKKQILGFECSSAVTTFRGRTYTAYYTTQIPISNGPWKFGGLPGLILEVITDDKMFNLYIMEVSDKEIRKLSNISFQKDASITWADFTKEYIKHAEAVIARIKARLKPGEFGQLYWGSKEIIYPPIQTGTGIRIE